MQAFRTSHKTHIIHMLDTKLRPDKDQFTNKILSYVFIKNKTNKSKSLITSHLKYFYTLSHCFTVSKMQHLQNLTLRKERDMDI